MWLGALDREPQHERYLAKEGGLGIGGHLALVLRQQYARNAQNHPGEAGEGEPDAQEARQKARPVYKPGEGEESQTPKDLRDNESLAMQLEEQHSESLPLRLFEYGQEVSPAYQNEGSD